MRGKQTTWLVSTALALFVFIWFHERHEFGSKEKEQRAEKLFPDFNSALVRGVELSGSNLTLRAIRSANAWTLTAPVGYPGEATAIEALLARVGELTTGRHIAARDVKRQSNGLASYGLQPPQATLRLEFPTNRVELRIGTTSQLGDRLYFQITGQPEVFTAGSNFFARLPLTADTWRDPALVQLDNVPFNRLEVRAPGRGFTFERDNSATPWRITKPVAARADNLRIESLLQQLRAWRVAAFVSDDPKTALEPLGLQPAEVELAFGQGSNDVLTVQFGKASTNDTTLVHARRLAGTNVVLVPRAPLESLRAPFTEYRDRRLATFDIAVVDHIEVRAEDAFALRRDTNGLWRVTEPLNFAADGALVTNLLTTLLSLEASEFVAGVVTDFNAYGLAKPARRYTVKSGAGAGVGTTTNLTLVSLDFGATNAGNLYARRADEESVYAVPAGNVARLPGALFQLRDRRLWNFTGSNVTAITVKMAGNTRKLVRDAAREWVNAPGTVGDPLTIGVNTLAVQSLMDELGTLTAVRWLDRGAVAKTLYKFDSGVAYELTLDVLVGDKTVPLHFQAGVTPQRRVMAAVDIEGEPVMFEFPASLFSDLVTHLTVPGPAPK